MTDWEDEIRQDSFNSGEGFRSRAGFKLSQPDTGSAGPEIPAAKEPVFRSRAMVKLNIPNLPPTGTPLDATPRKVEGHPGKAALGYLKENLMGQPASKFDMRTGEEPPSLWQGGPVPWQLGEVEPVFHGGGVFRKFSDDFMKSGTGGHVFGWGHYVSEEKGVGKYYRDLYGSGRADKELIRVNGKRLEEFLNPDDEIDLIAHKLWDAGASTKDTVKHLKDELEHLRAMGRGAELPAMKSYYNDQFRAAERAIEIAENNRIKALDSTDVSGLYKVKLFKGKSPDEYTFLDWDKPVNNQTKTIDVLRKIEKDNIAPSLARRIKRRDELSRSGGDTTVIDRQIKLLKEEISNPKLELGGTGESYYNHLTKGLGSKEAASKFLNRAGISGIRYPVGSLSGVKRTPAKKELNKLMQALHMNSANDYKTSYVDVVNAAEEIRIGGRGGTPHTDRIMSTLQKTGDEKLLDDYITALNNYVEPKNYVIFDPKNIEILEGPGQHHKFKPGFKERVEPGRFKQMAPGTKPVKGGIAMPKGMPLDTTRGNLMEARTVRQRGKVVKSMDFPKGGGLGGMRVVQVNQYQKSVKGAANYFQAFNDDISKESVSYLKWVDKNRNKSAIHVNGKTGISADLSTDCPNRLTGACPHCYVEPARIDLKQAKKAGLFTGTHGKKIVETPYNNEILGMPSDLVNAINRDGGLRMFSAGDYRGRKILKEGAASDYDQVKLMLEHAKEKNLFIKAITKQKELIDDFASHPNMRINLSTDDLPRVMSNAPTIEEAVQWAGKHKNVKIRSVAFNEAQATRHLEDARYDVITMYHGPTNFLRKEARNAYLNPKNKLYVKDPSKRKMIEDYPWDEEHQMYRTNKMMQVIELGNPEMVKRAGRKALLKETDTWVDHSPGKGVMKKLDEKYPGRLCCTGAKCPKGATKCGFGLGMATLIAGIYLPEWETEE